jgi:very-short-patch-repair endonuclease
MRRLLEGLDGTKRPSGSTLEIRLRTIIRKAGLPQPDAQHPILGGRYFIDFAYPEVRLGIEAEGYSAHGGRVRWQDDLERRNVLTALGWRILHFTWQQIMHRPHEVIRTIREALLGPSLLPDGRFSGTR